MTTPGWYLDAARHVIDAACAGHLCSDESDGAKTILRGLDCFNRQAQKHGGTAGDWLALAAGLSGVIRMSDPEMFHTDGTNDFIGFEVIDNATDSPISNPDAKASEEEAANLAAMRFIAADANRDTEAAADVFEAAMVNGTVRMMITALAMMAGASMVERMYRDGRLPPESVAILEGRPPRPPKERP